MPAPIRRTGTWVGLVVSLLLALLAWPLINTCVHQTRLMIPRIDGFDDARAMQAAIQRLYHDPGIWAVQQSFALLADPGLDEFDPARFKQIDSGNSLYDYGRLLLLLRRTNAAATQPEKGYPQLVREIRQLITAPPARLHLKRSRESMYTTLTANGMSPRRAAASMDFFSTGEYRAVLRELTQRLKDAADLWMSRGQIEDAREAQRLILRLLTDLVTDSPIPEVALLAAEPVLPETLRALEHEQPARIIEEFHPRWHGHHTEERVNIMPHTGNLPLANHEHTLVMRSLCAAVITIVTWLVFAFASLLWLLVSGLSNTPDDGHPRWHRPNTARLISPVVALVPFVFLVLFVTGNPGRFTWLISYPTIPASIMLAAWVPLVVKVIARLNMQPPAGFEDRWRPRWLLILLALLVLATVVMALVWPVPNDSWRPPPVVQRFRILIPSIGVFVLVSAAFWSLVDFLYRRRARLPAGVYARANLSVAAGSLLLLSVVGLGILLANQYRDQRHEQAFVRAAADPLADRLGPAWDKDYFEPVRRLLQE
ncbi:MAG: hypothetical protein GXY44_13595 [Phycisphaerales bacterium]|nr:hypothetical protein [Phycisphaerales bacterium]